jgi:outer membrane receptor protein involved in Fe transport
MLTLPAVMLLASQAAMAQQERVLEEIIVTARKREENVLEIPESVATLSGTLIEQTNIRQLKDISLLVSNLYMSKRLDGFPNVSIRGVGGFGNTQGVGYYLDDVQIFTDASSRFGDLERIEVLKGPQGILYGGANIGGAVKFVAVRPDPEAFVGRVKLRAGEDGYFDGEGVLNIPLGTNWATRLFGFYEQDDSYLVNPNSPRQNGGVNSNDENVGEWDRYGVRATLAGDMTDRFSVYATLRYNKFEGPNNAWNIELDGNLTHTPVVDTSFNAQHEKETVGASLELAYEFDNFTLTSITSYTDTDSDRESDLDSTQEFVIDLFRPQELTVLTQELRFTSTGAGPLQWQAGGYYLNYERDIDSVQLFLGGIEFLAAGCCGLPVPPPLDATESAVFAVIPFEVSDRERQQLAGFANVSYRWTNLELAGGVRVDRWEADRTNRLTAVSGSQEETEVLGRGSLTWFFDDDRSMVYGLVSQGFEPGDFNLANFAGVNSLFGYEAEEATQYEIGYKGRLANDRVVLTLAAFLIDYEKRQFELQTVDPMTGGVIEGIVNVGDSENWGLEADLVWSVHDNWTLSAGFGWVEAEWDNGTISPVTGADLSGQTPPNTSDWSGVAAVDYSRKLNADTHLFGRLQVRHKAEASTNAQFFDAPGDDFPFWTNPDFTVIDLNLGVGWQNWEFAIQVENLTDEDYYIDAQEFPNFAGTARPTAPGAIIIGTLEQPRRVVGSIQFRF